MAPNVHSGINTQQLSECVLFVSVFHTHPHATELLYAVNSTITTGMIPQGGTRFIFNNVTAGSGIVLPQGSVYFEINDNCDPVTFVSALNSEDPGASPVAQLFFGMPPNVVSTSLDPRHFILGTDKCLQRCGLMRSTQPMAQQDPRVPGNTFLSGVSTGMGAATSSTSYSRSIMQTADLIAAIENSIALSVICISATVASSADITTCNELARGLKWIQGCWEQRFCVQ
ncbi:RmlC-like cupin [Sparassis crispa]|uniref:RmlC-like cupin n=1 Tax=Sparassis crispa TaxID=139825 RepID=A0A401G618_9APHY|nr:RmlC-like cupin [Sparassis crispa]GBE77609.1 RmlC-like cupin [Sparassis crispa]